MNSGEQNKLFILIDGHSLAFRAYYAFAKSRSGPLRTSTGIPTSVCFGFLNSLLQLLETQKPAYLAVAFDLAAPSFRHEADVNYKANRQETPLSNLAKFGQNRGCKFYTLFSIILIGLKRLDYDQCRAK